MKNKASSTGPGPMVLVAIEQGFPVRERIVVDELAEQILPLGSRLWVRLLRPVASWIVNRTEAKVPGLWGGIMARKRYIDDAIAGSPTGAVVNLGAGFDTRPYRLTALADVPTWEVDLASNIDRKRSRLRKIFGEVPAHVTLVPIDFDREDLAIVLASHGYPDDNPTLFIWEGVTQYLSEAGIRATFAFLAAAPAGSRLVFTYTPRDFIDGDALYGQEYLYDKMRVKDRIWHFGFEPDAIETVVGDHGWRLLEHLGYDKLAERYVRPTGRELGWMAIERIVLAEKASSRASTQDPGMPANDT